MSRHRDASGRPRLHSGPRPGPREPGPIPFLFPCALERPQIACAPPRGPRLGQTARRWWRSTTATRRAPSQLRLERPSGRASTRPNAPRRSFRDGTLQSLFRGSASWSSTSPHLPLFFGSHVARVRASTASLPPRSRPSSSGVATVATGRAAARLTGAICRGRPRRLLHAQSAVLFSAPTARLHPPAAPVPPRRAQASAPRFTRRGHRHLVHLGAASDPGSRAHHRLPRRLPRRAPRTTLALEGRLLGVIPPRALELVMSGDLDAAPRRLPGSISRAGSAAGAWSAGAGPVSLVAAPTPSTSTW